MDTNSTAAEPIDELADVTEVTDETPLADIDPGDLDEAGIEIDDEQLAFILDGDL